jgi:hypothetical protein
MRTTVLLLALIVPAAAPAAAQSSVSQWHPRPTFGLALGVSDDGESSADGKSNPIVSGTYEIPIGDTARFRFEAARTRQPIPSFIARDAIGDVAHISRLTLSLAGLKRSAALVTPYGGGGIGFYRATFDRASATKWIAGAYLHGGIEVQAGDAVAIDGEIGLHLTENKLYPSGALLGEAVLRLKIGL